MPRIQANRDAIDDRFSVLGFTVRSESPLFEIGVATDPALFQADHKAARSRRNFFSSRSAGVLRARRGEAVYLLPPDVMANFVGQPRLYFGLATYRENSKGAPDSVQSPSSGNMYVNLSGLTERGLRRLVTSARVSSYGQVNGRDASLEWGGDAWPQTAASAATKGNGAATVPSMPVAGASAPYDDGFGRFPEADAVPRLTLRNGDEPRPASADPRPAPTSASAQAMQYRAGLGGAPRALPRGLLSRAQEVVKPYGGGAGGLLEQLGFLLEGIAWFAGVPDTTAFPHSAICRTYAPLGDGRIAVGTAFYIGPKLLLTAAHVVHGKSSIVVVPGKNGAGRDSDNEPFGRFTVSPADWVEHENYAPPNRDFDFAVIRASQTAPNNQWFPLAELRETRAEGVVVCGYSTSSRQTDALSRLISMHIDSEKQHLHSGHVRVLSTEETFDYDVQTLPGASGAPVYSVLDGDSPRAVVRGVHVADADDTTNRGCRLTDAKIAWIATRASELGVATALALRTHTPASRASPGRAARTDAQSRAQGLFDLSPVDLKLRVFVPAPIVYTARPIVSDVVAGVDGRNFQAEGGTSRVEIAAKFHFGGEGAGALLSDVSRSFGESINYRFEDTVAVAGKPEWWRALRPGAQPTKRVHQTVSDDKVRVALGGSSSDGLASMHENATVVTFEVHAGNPLISISADIDATLAVMLKVDGDRVKARVRGGHDEFPAYELYANGVLVYAYDPVAEGGTPFGLLGDGVWDVNPDTDYVDVGPASDVRLIGPVRNRFPGAQALDTPAISIHWDDVPYYPQTSPASCWAASAAMVVGWRDRVSISDNQIERVVPVIDAYRTGLWPRDRRQLADAWNLVAEPPASYTLEAWAQMLKAYGPLYIDMTWSGTNGGHVRVLVGMESDGSPDGSGTTMFMHDPWPDTPGRIKLPFVDFLELYENRTGNSGGQLLYQILHADRLPADVRPVTKSPFALTLASEAEPAEAEQGVPSDPAALPGAGSVGSDFQASMSSRDGGAGSLPAPPAPIVQQQALRARPLAADVVEVESPVEGTKLRRERGNDDGVVSWELDQLDGLKSGNADASEPAAPQAPTPRDGETLILSEWPYLAGEDGARISMDLEVRWQHDGSGVGNIRMRRHAASASDGHRLAVTARVADVAARFPTENPVCAALDIVVEYRFTRADASTVAAIYTLRLFGNGRHNCVGRWLKA